MGKKTHKEKEKQKKSTSEKEEKVKKETGFPEDIDFKKFLGCGG